MTWFYIGVMLQVLVIFGGISMAWDEKNAQELANDIGFGANPIKDDGDIELEGRKLYFRGGTDPSGLRVLENYHYIVFPDISFSIAKISWSEDKEKGENFYKMKLKSLKDGIEWESEEALDRKKTVQAEEKGISGGNEKTLKKFMAKIKFDGNDSEPRKEMIEAIWREFKLTTIETQLKELIKNGEKQIILTGAPGTGKTYTAKEVAKAFCGGDKKRIKFVQFHSSYDYSDFVEGLRPVVLEKESEVQNKDGKLIRKNFEKTTAFVRLDGTFKEFCRKAADDENKDNNSDEIKYFFIIDEINRADLSKVFGELMYALEDGYRGEENKVQTQYRNLPVYEIDNSTGCAVRMEKDKFQDGFYIPNNVYIIGTMNDIDRSVEAFDFALRRRFQWITVKAINEIDALDRYGRRAGRKSGGRSGRGQLEFSSE